MQSLKEERWLGQRQQPLSPLCAQTRNTQRSCVPHTAQHTPPAPPAQGHPDPGYVASWAASRAILAPQTCKPVCAAAGMGEGVFGAVERGRLGSYQQLRRVVGRFREEAAHVCGVLQQAVLAGGWWHHRPKGGVEGGEL